MEGPIIINFTPSTLIQTSLIALVGALVLVTLVHYRRRRKLLPPGPFPWPIVGNFLQLRSGLTPQTLAEVAKKYGDIVLLQMGQRKVLVISSPEAAREVLQTQGVEFGSRARNLVFDMTTGQGQDLAFADYGEHWRKMKRIATVPFFTSKVVQKFRETWEGEIEQAMKDMEAAPGATASGIEVRERLQLMMYSIVYQMMFRRSFAGLDDPLYQRLLTLNLDNRRLVHSFKYNFADFLPSLKPFLRRYLQDTWTAHQRRLAFLRDAFLYERRKLKSEEKIGVDFFEDALMKGELNEKNVLYLVQNMNIAAVDTTLWSLEWGIAELVNNPRMQKKIVDELDSILGKGVTLTEPNVPRLPYLQAVVKEILRVHMVIPMLLPHMNLEAVKLCGYDIPAGCRVLVNAWGIANDPRYWESPEVFNPERFLDNKIDSTGNDFQFIPFGSGRRSCPGSVIALPLMGLVLGRLVQAFELLPPPSVDKVNLRAIGGQLSLTIAEEAKVVFKPRV